MELSQGFLIDMAINAGGYLLAGIISVILFSLFTKKKKSSTFDEVIEEITTDEKFEDVNNLAVSTANEKVDYISFGSSQNENVVLKKKTIPEEVPLQQNNGRMNRKEAINLAKKMLLAGATQEKIKRVLPVSDSELALLNLNIR